MVLFQDFVWRGNCLASGRTDNAIERKQTAHGTGNPDNKRSCAYHNIPEIVNLKAALFQLQIRLDLYTVSFNIWQGIIFFWEGGGGGGGESNLISIM